MCATIAGLALAALAYFFPILALLVPLAALVLFKFDFVLPTTLKTTIQRYGSLNVLLAACVGVTFLLYRPAGSSQSPGPAATPAATPATTPADNLRLVAIVDRVMVGGTEVPAGIVTARTPQAIAISGWTVYVKAPAPDLVLLVDDSIPIPTSSGGLRPDVAVAFKNPAYAASAFDVVIPANSLQPGEHHVSMLIRSLDRGGYHTKTKAQMLKISIKP